MRERVNVGAQWVSRKGPHGDAGLAEKRRRGNGSGMSASCNGVHPGKVHGESLLIYPAVVRGRLGLNRHVPRLVPIGALSARSRERVPTTASNHDGGAGGSWTEPANRRCWWRQERIRRIHLPIEADKAHGSKSRFRNSCLLACTLGLPERVCPAAFVQHCLLDFTGLSRRIARLRRKRG